MTLSAFAGVRLLAWAVFIVMAWRLSTNDWRMRKIPNRELAYGAGLVFACYLLLLVDTMLGLWGVTSTWLQGAFYRDLLFHLILTAVAALSFWRLRVWPAGDAKLYLLLGAIAPLLASEPNFLAGRYFLAALINTFLPACLFVFVQVLPYIWRTRLRHAMGFLHQAGVMRGWAMAREGFERSLHEGAAQARELCQEARTNPGECAVNVAYQGAMFTTMIGLSAAAHSIIPSGMLRSILIVGVLYFVSNGAGANGKWIGWGGAAATAAAYWFTPPGGEFRTQFAVAAGALSVFTLFFQFGILWTMRLIGGRVPEVILPFAGILIALVLSILGLARAYLPLALMGIFFGLCIVFVRIWEEEEKIHVPVEDLERSMLAHRSFLDAAEAESPGYIERHFEFAYADGMTARQLKAVRGWASRQGLEMVAIQTTIAFAFWIFLGYFLTWALGGSVVEKLV